jgi:hypothetical protein
MAVTAKWYGQGALGLFSATAARRVDWVNDDVRVSLHTATYTPDQDTHDFFNDATNELTTAGGYTAGGAALAGKSVTYTAGTNIVALLASATTWATATFTCRYAVVWVNTAGASSTDPLLGYVDFGADQSPAGIDFVINWHATEGVLKATVA